MDRIGLTFEEYAELKVRPRVGADAAFGHAAEMTLAEMFPMTLMAASSHLRSRGYDCRPQMLEVLVRDGVVTPAAPDAWSQADVDAAAQHFEDCDLFTPYAAMCQTLECRYVDFLKPLAQAIMLMRTQRDDEDNDLDLKPATLLVTPELETTARALLNSEYIQRAVDVPTGNSLRQAVNLEVEPRLANTAKFGNAASTAHWYLFTAPSLAPMVVAFLNGQQTPTVEYFGLDANVERLAAAWRVYHDFGTALCDPKAPQVVKTDFTWHRGQIAARE